MRLYFKHLFTSIRRRPLQPLILVLTVVLSVLVVALAFGIRDTLAKERTLSNAAGYGRADITVSGGVDNESRFLFADEALAILGEGYAATGLYELPVLFAGETVSGAAADLHTLGCIFSLRFTAYGSISENNLGEIVLISQAFAEKHGLAVGDALNMRVLNRERSYTVAAISDRPYAASHDILLDVSSLTRLLAAGSPFLSALGDRFRPAGTLYIDVPEEKSIEQTIAVLAASPQFSDKAILSVDAHTDALSATKPASLIVLAIILLTVVLSIAVTYSCFGILAAERQEENEVFLAAGAQALHLDLAGYVEALVYFAVGAPIGLGLAHPMLSPVVRFAGFRHASAHLTAVGYIGAVLVPLFALLLSLTVLLLLRRRGRARRQGVHPSWAALLLLLFLPIALAPPSLHFAAGVFGIVILLLLLFLLTPPILRRLMRALSRAFDRRRDRRARVGTPAFYYAARNAEAIPLLQGSARLFALLLCGVLVSVFLLLCSFGFLGGIRHIFTGEYAVTGATERCYGVLDSCDGVERVDRVHFATATGENRFLVLSAESTEAIAEDLGIRYQPKGKEAVISADIATRYGLSTGDDLTFSVRERSVTVQVAAILRTGVPLVYFDCTHYGIPYNMLLVVGKEEVADAVLLQELTAASAGELAAILPTEELMELKAATFEIYALAGVVLLFAILIFSVIGLLDNLCESYRSRRGEFSLFVAAGMSRGGVRRMKLFEVMLTFLPALLLALFVAALALPLLQLSLGTMNDFYLNLQRFLCK